MRKKSKTIFKQKMKKATINYKECKSKLLTL